MISDKVDPLSEFSSQYCFQFLPLFFKQTKPKGKKTYMYIVARTDQNSLDKIFFQETS